MAARSTAVFGFSLYRDFQFGADALEQGVKAAFKFLPVGRGDRRLSVPTVVCRQQLSARRLLKTTTAVRQGRYIQGISGLKETLEGQYR